MAKQAAERPAVAPGAIELLSAELSRLTTETQTFWSVLSSLIAAVLLAAGGFLALQKQAADLQASNLLVDDWIWGMAATVPWMVIAYAVVQTVRAVARSYYARHIEITLHDLCAPDPSPSFSERPTSPVLDTLYSVVDGNRAGLLEIRTIHLLEYLTIVGALVVASVSELRHIRSDGVLIAFVALDALIALAIASLAYRAGSRGRYLWRSLARRVDVALEQGLAVFPKRSERRLVSYLLVPRIADLLVKTIGLHATATVIGWWAADGRVSFAQSARIGGAVLLCFEFLGYQGRYMVNDYLGKDSDQKHGSAGLRLRLPPLDSPTRKMLFGAVLAVRAVGALVLPFVLLDSRHLAIVLAAASVGAWLLGALYERFRVLANRTGRVVDLTRPVVGVYITVGVSYGARAAMGLWFGSDGKLSGAVLAVTYLAFYLYGLSLVLMSWVLEAQTFVMSSKRLFPARRYRPALGEKSHIGWLGVRAGILLSGAAAMVREPKADPEREAELEAQHGLITAGSLTMPWNWAVTGSCALVLMSGWLLRDGTPSYDARSALLLIPGALAGLVAVRWPTAALVWAPGLLVAGVPLSIHQWGGTGPLLLVPLTMVVVVYAATRGMSYKDLMGLPHTLHDVPERVGQAVILVGHELWR